MVRATTLLGEALQKEVIPSVQQCSTIQRNNPACIYSLTHSSLGISKRELENCRIGANHAKSLSNLKEMVDITVDQSGQFDCPKNMFWGDFSRSI